MKKSIFTSIAVSLLGFLTSCLEDDVLNDVQEAAADQASSVISGVASLDLDGMNGVLNTTPATRTRIIYNSNGELSYRSKKGDRMPVFVYYKQNNRQKIVEDKVYVAERNRLGFDTKIPTDFDRRKGNLYMRAIIGKQPGANNGAWASGMTADGKLRIEVSHTVDAASQQFDLPFCAPPRLIKPSGDTYLHLKAFSSWFAVTLGVQKNINPDFMMVNSDAVATNGTLGLFSSENGEFIWQPEVTMQKNVGYDVKNFEVKARQKSRPLIVWFIPILSKESQRPTTLSLQIKAIYSNKMPQYSKKISDKNE